jgi:hypothetical protein
MLDPDSGERISFYRNASRQAVYQSVGQQVLPLIDGVIVPTNGFQLRYFDGCNREIVASGELSDADRARIRRVSIILMVSDPTGRGTVSAETAATVRNRASQCENPA